MSPAVDLALIFPPLWYYPHIPPELVGLAGVVRSSGLTCKSFDLNTDSFDYFLSTAFLHEIGAHRSNPRLRFVDVAKQIMRSQSQFYDLSAYTKAKGALNAAWSAISARYAPTQMNFLRFKTVYDEQSFESCLYAANDVEHNPYISYFEQRLLPTLGLSSPRCIGFIYVHPDQVIPMLTAVLMLRRAGFDGHITVLGSLEDQVNFGRYLRRERHQEYARLFALIDSVIEYEAEDALVALVHALAKGGPLSHVPNLIRFEHNALVRPPSITITDLRKLPPPDYEDVSLQQYFFPEPVFAMLTSRGCYWDRCTFCAIAKNQLSYRLVPVKKVVDDIVQLQRLHGVRWFHFRDMLMSPAYVQRFCAELLRRGVGIRWICRARFEDAFTPALFEQMAAAGCVQVWFGLESASQRILDLMDKGTRIASVDRILHACARAGIGAHILMMYGFPTETPDDIEATVAFSEERADIIDSYSYSRFTLFAETPIFERREAFGLNLLSLEDKLLHYQFNYRETSPYTFSVDEHQALDRRLMQAIPMPLLHVSHVSLYRNHFRVLPWKAIGSSPHTIGLG